MSRGRPIIELTLSEQDHDELSAMARSRSLPAGITLRAKIVLRCAQNRGTPAVAAELGTSVQTACKWRERFRQGGVAALCDEVRSGRPRTIREERVAEWLRRSIDTKPKVGTHWSCRRFALEHGVSKSTVQRLWESFQLQPHRHQDFKFSTDAHFVEKVVDVTGLYLAPPEKALVLAVDEKSQCQALERTQPALPLGLGYAEGYTHDYTRHGTTTLFAALNVAGGRIISRCKPGHRHTEFIAFLRQIDANTPPELDLPVIVDNYATHKHPKVKLWLARHPRFHFHFTPPTPRGSTRWRSSLGSSPNRRSAEDRSPASRTSSIKSTLSWQPTTKRPSLLPGPPPPNRSSSSVLTLGLSRIAWRGARRARPNVTSRQRVPRTATACCQTPRSLQRCQWSKSVSSGGKSWARAHQRQPSRRRGRMASSTRRLGSLERAPRGSGRSKNFSSLVHGASLRSLG